jgi:hypothetical protein
MSNSAPRRSCGRSPAEEVHYLFHGVCTLYRGVAVTVALLTNTSFRRTSHATADWAELFDTPIDSASSW